MTEHSAAEQREADLPMLNNGGTCRIVEVNRHVFAPTLAEVWTDLTEKFLVFSYDVLADVLKAQRYQRLVALTIRRGEKSQARYIAAVALLPSGLEAVYPCVRCGAPADQIPAERTRAVLGATAPDGTIAYSCPACAHLMLVTPKLAGGAL